MSPKKNILRHAPKLAAMLALLPDAANACAICVSNISYNYAPFTAVWVLVLFIWTAFLAGMMWYRRRNGLDLLPLQHHFQSARKYLIVVVALFILGMHLAAIIFLPWLLIKTAFARGTAEHQFVKNAAKSLLVVLLVSAPVLYKFLPQTSSEVSARDHATNVRKELRRLISPQRKIPAQKQPDPFAYQIFDVPVLGWVVQSPGFYRPLNSSNTLQSVSTADHRAAWSRGPDGKFDLTPASVASALNQIQKGTAPLFDQHRYDPTNGVLSAGDIIEFTEQTAQR